MPSPPRLLRTAALLVSVAMVACSPTPSASPTVPPSVAPPSPTPPAATETASPVASGAADAVYAAIRGQVEAIRAIAPGGASVEVVPDLAGLDRVVRIGLRKP